MSRYVRRSHVEAIPNLTGNYIIGFSVHDVTGKEVARFMVAEYGSKSAAHWHACRLRDILNAEAIDDDSTSD